MKSSLAIGASRSGMWARQYPHQAAAVAARYRHQPPEVIRFALTTPKVRIDCSRFIPRRDEIQELANRMHRFGLVPHTDITAFIGDRFARRANLSGITDFASIPPR